MLTARDLDLADFAEEIGRCVAVVEANSEAIGQTLDGLEAFDALDKVADKLSEIIGAVNKQNDVLKMVGDAVNTHSSVVNAHNAKIDKMVAAVEALTKAMQPRSVK